LGRPSLADLNYIRGDQSGRRFSRKALRPSWPSGEITRVTENDTRSTLALLIVLVRRRRNVLPPQVSLLQARARHFRIFSVFSLTGFILSGIL
jgi:hypothetical protein